MLSITTLSILTHRIVLEISVILSNMTTIHFFDTTKTDAEALRALTNSALPGRDVEFHSGPAAVAADAVIISPFVTSHVTDDMMAAMPNLKLIACRSTGYDNIDLPAAAKRGIAVCNVPSYGEHTVAEYAFGLMLSITRKIPLAIDMQKAGQPADHRLQGIDLLGKTLGILGAGRIGCHMASMARGFGMTVVAFDTMIDQERAKRYGFTYRPLKEVLATSDIVSIHVPNVPGTKHMLDAQAITRLKPSAIIINTARGEVIDTAALIAALQHGHIAAAALDVFEHQTQQHSLEISTLQALPNVILTNHNAFNTVEAVGRINQSTVENIAAFLADALPAAVTI
jgi:D-lactate dehydrogenase